MVKEMVKELKVHVELGPEPTKGVTKVTLPADLNASYHSQIVDHFGETDAAKIRGPLNLVVQPNENVDASLADDLSKRMRNLKSIIVRVRGGLIQITSVLPTETQMDVQPTASMMQIPGTDQDDVTPTTAEIPTAEMSKGDTAISKPSKGAKPSGVPMTEFQKRLAAMRNQGTSTDSQTAASNALRDQFRSP